MPTAKIPLDTTLGRIDLTPELADELHHDHMVSDAPSRMNDPDKIREYTEDMLAGEWDSDYDRRAVTIVGPDGFRQDGEYYPPGTIWDGWHRINAVIDSQVTIRVWLTVL